MSESQKEQKERKKAITEELSEIPPLLRITPEGRSVYPISLTANNRSFSEVHMDSHCFEGSSKNYITPELIYHFSLKLNNNKETFIPEERKDGWEYFAEEIFTYERKPYRLAWC